jgi:hypothetical protein
MGSYVSGGVNVHRPAADRGGALLAARRQRRRARRVAAGPRSEGCHSRGVSEIGYMDWTILAVIN